MKIDELTAMNFMAFSGLKNRSEVHETVDEKSERVTFHDCLHLNFSDGINVIIGENAIGKTTLLKMIYAAAQWSIKNADPNKTKKLSDFFHLILILAIN